ncbi:hypothetical protein HN371_13665 [Candidatus Poribacteria bacterium]|jgi:hypothetical protein|nr:hypothetical protein [Candidatus Poribacteria bacterium]MBT5534664.1 hypothetical protein [Candidatus Poribacteria bacterium]MBT5713343.1 hypothetical protein [Candidatus Poribacteria bacterium]MBT7095985.1 hypothetical protein [Candidatus Poribacteria bacterium]MBT7804690.1 hypothetical protein [Candidatus Poribacteria bacterium]
MRRLYAGTVLVALTLGVTSAHAVTSSSETFSLGVGTIMEFITLKSNTAGSTSIVDWDVDDDAGGASGNSVDEAVVVFRLVTNVDATLTGTFVNTSFGTNAGSAEALINTSTDEILLTYANIESDGDGATAVTLASGHNNAAAHTGFNAAELSTNFGVSEAGTNPAGFAYIGGLRSGGDEPADTGTSAYSTAAAGDFLDVAGSTSHITHINHDGAVLLTVTVRGFNGEDFGLASDSTEAPDPGTYSTLLQLTAVP